ncbi:YccF domain-containing protein [Trueperella bialowiezensis]|uniref:Inner membrane protein yccF n=1 Tax=Trueperella bialowiezensis TaxID=312285 RepID=A0A448PE23_9ACTO|nr:YccF domain-containing protein [Trueperella bialowiezensis]VEI13168.1 Inner membrane protein yccF [Trueperella bialowiezensis]
MRFLLNIIWVIFGGLALFLEYLLAGAVSFIFIITIPASIACFRIAGYVLWPFGRVVVDKPGAGAGSTFMNVVWFLVAGLWLSIGHIVTAAVQAITIIGIPLAIANIKLIPVTCFPFGKMVVSADQARFYNNPRGQQIFIGQ